MKICYISNSAAPSKNASSLQTSKLCEGLSKQGNNVLLILPNTGDTKKNYFNFYNIKSRFKITRIKFFKKFPTGIFYYLYSIISILKSNFRKQDLYITRNFFTSLLLCILKKNHILEVHDDILIEGRVVQFLIRYLRMLNFKQVVKIITTTYSLKKRYIEYGVNKNKIFVLHNASSLTPFFKKSKKKKKLNIGYFGSLFKSRGVELILDLSKKDKKNDYFVYGGSKNDIFLLKKNYKNKNLKLSPYIPYSKISSKIKKIDVFLLPYTSKVTVSGDIGDISKYTSPLKVFDYMICGKLLICSNLKVLREVLKDRKNSLLIKKYNKFDNWYQVIKAITKNYSNYEQIRLNAYTYAKKHNIVWRTKELMKI